MLSEYQKKLLITVSLFERDNIAVAALAERNGVSVSWVAWHAVAQFVERHRSSDGKLPLRIDR